jgi:uncharacterized membrane protein (UPF0127 family)
MHLPTRRLLSFSLRLLRLLRPPNASRLGLLWLAASGCELGAACHTPGQPPPRAAQQPPGNSGAGDQLPRGQVTIRSATGTNTFDVELALDETSRAHGLMYRREVPASAGMLFVFDEEEPHSFWMKNTLVPLDMLFISNGGTIAAIIENAEPLTTSPRNPNVLSRYVLELRGGTAFARGIRVGDAVEMAGVPKG